MSFVSRCFQKGALRRVQGAVIGGDKLIGVCHISSSELRGLGSSTVPADLKLRDPRCGGSSGGKRLCRVVYVAFQLCDSLAISAGWRSGRPVQSSPVIL